MCAGTMCKAFSYAVPDLQLAPAISAVKTHIEWQAVTLLHSFAPLTTMEILSPIGSLSPCSNIMGRHLQNVSL